MSQEFRIASTNVDLTNKKATLILQRADGVNLVLGNFTYDKPGDQTETEIEKLALVAAKRVLKDALESL